MMQKSTNITKVEYWNSNPEHRFKHWPCWKKIVLSDCPRVHVFSYAVV